MTFRIGKKEEPHVAIWRLLMEELGLALEHLDLACREDADSRALHEARRGIKKARAIIALGRSVLGARGRIEDRRLRLAARILARHRELDANLLVLEGEGSALQEADKDVLRTAIRLHHQTDVRPADRNPDLARVQVIIRALRKRIERAVVFIVPQRALRRRFRKAYKAARKAFAAAAADRTAESLHDWRKRNKLLLYQARLLRGVGEPGLATLTSELAALDDRLGRGRDCLLLAGILRGMPVAYVPIKSDLGLNALLEQAWNDENVAALEAGTRIFKMRSRLFVRHYLGR